jgi:hypothetical protein
MVRSILLLLFLVPLGEAQAEAQKPVPTQLMQGEPLDLCKIDAHIDQYKEQRVRVHAYIQGEVLHDPKCLPMAYVVWKPDSKGKLKSLRKVDEKGGGAIVTVEGIVHGPKPYPIDPRLPEGIKNALKDQVIGYGHMGNCRMEIEVDRILDVKSIKSAKGRETR